MTALKSETTAAWTELITVSRILLERVEAELKAAGLPPLSWYDALLEIDGAGPDGLRPYALQQRLLLPQYGTSRLLDRIVKAGLIERVPCEKDGRGHLLRITDPGRKMRRAMWPVYRAALKTSVEDRLDAEDLKKLAGLLRRLRPAI